MRESGGIGGRAMRLMSGRGVGECGSGRPNALKVHGAHNGFEVFVGVRKVVFFQHEGEGGVVPADPGDGRLEAQKAPKQEPAQHTRTLALNNRQQQLCPYWSRLLF